MRCSRSLLVDPLTGQLVLGKHQAPTVDLLKGNVGAREVVVVDGVLVQGVHRRVRVRGPLVEDLLRGQAASKLLVVGVNQLEVGRRLLVAVQVQVVVHRPVWGLLARDIVPLDGAYGLQVLHCNAGIGLLVESPVKLQSPPPRRVAGLDRPPVYALVVVVPFALNLVE